MLVGADHKRAGDAFARLTGLSADHIFRKVYESDLVSRFELGEMEALKFRRSVCAALEADISDELFDEAWCETLYEFEGVGSLLRMLGRDFDLFMLSNTNEIHFEKVRSMFPDWIALFKGFYLSYEVGLKKPSREYFETALERFSLDPKSCVFLDDRSENVSAAQALGIRSNKVRARGLDVEDLRSWGILSNLSHSL